MGADDDRPSQPRLFIAQTHETLGRVARGIEWLGNWIGTVAIAVLMLLVLHRKGVKWAVPASGEAI